jgi:ParB-like chromosome segregation protein Spo0J
MMTAKTKLPTHPLADMFPEMLEADYREFSADIAKNGLQEEIVTYQGKILDGRHRYRACLENGIEPRFREYEGDNPLGFIISANLHRRHLDASVRAIIAAKFADHKPGGDRSKPQNYGLTHSQAAELLNISPRQVDKASAFNNAVARGTALPELAELVSAGSMSLNRAEKIARLPKDRQHEQIVALSSNGSAQPGPRQTRQQWARRSENIGRDAELLCGRVARLAAEAEKAGKSTPEVRRCLAGVCRHAARWLSAEAEHLDPANALPLEEV